MECTVLVVQLYPFCTCVPVRGVVWDSALPALSFEVERLLRRSRGPMPLAWAERRQSTLT